MDRLDTNDLYRCDLCRGSVDAATIDRARHSWQPLIICERCVRGTDDGVTLTGFDADNPLGPRAADLGASLLERLKPLEELPVVGEVRGVGMMLGVELVADKEKATPFRVEGEPIANAIRREHGVIVRQSENDVGHTLVLSPPLVLSSEEAGQIADSLMASLSALAPTAGAAA